jgi:hypothetical protein
VIVGQSSAVCMDIRLFERCVLSDRSHCYGLITRLEESYRVYESVTEYDREASKMRGPWPTRGYCAKKINIWNMNRKNEPPGVQLYERC